MILSGIRVKNFRSIFGDEPISIETGENLNLFVGPNNCGKSNVLRAVALALQDVEGEKFCRDTDLPSFVTRAYPTITLTFKQNTKNPVTKTLLRFVGEYEKSAGANNTHADEGLVHLRVVYRKDRRDAHFVVKGKPPGSKGDKEKLTKAINQFNKSVKFVYIESGESLKSFLQGAFQELAHTVMRERLKHSFDQAQKDRQQFVNSLKGGILESISKYTLKEVRHLISEITELSIEPEIPGLDEILSRADINICDAAETSIANKGTGVRGALLISLLAYIAQHYPKRSIVYAIEEPESFLHPQAQSKLLADLLKLGKQKHVSILASTHSPFLIDKTDNTFITGLRKNVSGGTEVIDQKYGNESHLHITSHLFGDQIIPAALGEINTLGDDIKGVLFVEGYTDKMYIEASLTASSREDLLENMEIRYGSGAMDAALKGLLLKSLVGDSVPIAFLFDRDSHGNEAIKILKEKFQVPKKRLMKYGRWLNKNPQEHPVEAEDIFPNTFVEGFINNHMKGHVEEKMLYKDGSSHYGFSQETKNLFMDYVKDRVKKCHANMWVKIITDIRKDVFACQV